MSDLLHDPLALSDIGASWAEPARSWARALLAVWAPETRPGPPVADLAWDPVLVRAEAPAPWIAAGWEGALIPEGAAALAASVPAWGHEVDGSLRAACLAALGDGAPADPYLALTLARSGGAPAAAARAAAKAGAPRWVVAAVVLYHLRGADPQGAMQAFAALDDDEAWACLVACGAPEDLPEAPRDLETAARAGRDLAGGPPWSPPPNRGSRRSRARALAADALAGAAGVLPGAIVAALTRDRSPAFEARVVALAGWTAGPPPDTDPVVRALGHRGGPATWAGAWGAAKSAPQAVDEAVRRIDQGCLGSAVLAARLDPARAAAPALAQAVRTPTLSWLSVACALAPHLEAQVARGLAGPHRHALLPVAAWCPTPGVLAALLDLPVPAAPAARRDWAWALASTGDVVAARRVMALEAAVGPAACGAGPGLVRALGLAPDA